MLLLIDAYNLLHLSDQLGRQRGDGWLQKARERLISTLAEHLGSELCSQTCLVFDSKDGPKDLPSAYVSHGIELLFAVDHEEADDLLEELIARHATPKRLMVVSSDHRIQKAAGRRSAKFMDADVWYGHLTEHGPRLAIVWPPNNQAASGKGTASDKPARSLTAGDVESWLAEFSLEGDETSELLREESTRSQGRASQRAEERPTEPLKSPGVAKQRRASDSPSVSPSSPPSKTPPESRRRLSRGGKQAKKGAEKPDPGAGVDPGLANPFPEGYGEDLLE